MYKPILIWSPLGDLVRCILSFNFCAHSSISERFEICEEGIIWHVCFYLKHKHTLLILSRLTDLVTCSARFNIESDESISQIWNTVGR